jgi:hypothetical protein
MILPKSEKSNPSHIEFHHWQEWLNSGIDPDIIELNVNSLSGEIVYEYLLTNKLDALGSGKKVPYSSQYVTVEVSRALKPYEQVISGGWWCHGADPLNEYAPMDWGCFKSDTPRIDIKKNKPIKYEHPPGQATRAFFLNVPVWIWQIIADKYGVPIGDCRNFWEWVHINALPITLCEGAKKAAALLSCGIIAVALPGINGAYRKIEDKKKHRLIADIQYFADIPREFIICFDNDSKPSTIENVRKAIASTSKLLKSKKGTQVQVTSWKYPEKGIDDVLAAHGQDAIENIFATALPINRWQSLPYYHLTRKINLSLTQRYLGDILSDIPQKIIGVKSPKGTGKTESLKPLTEKLSSEGYSIYLVSHRIQLCQALCNRLNIPYVDDDSKSKSQGFGLVIDSLHSDGKGQFDVENNVDLLTNKYAVIIDEVEQVLWHLLNSSTEVRNHRPEIIRQLKLLLLNADKILCLDADLSDVSLDFIECAAQCNNDETYLINNEYKESGYTIHNHVETTPVNWLRDLLKVIDNGDKVLIASDSQKFKARFSTQNIESIILKKCPHLEGLILRIDSETIADPSHPAYGCITKLNEIISQFSIVLISPSVGTGISIDIKNHFNSVWGCFQGVQSENAVRQQLMRLRDNVPRHLWISPGGLSWVGDGSTSMYSVLLGNKRKFKIHIQQLKDSAEIEISEDSITIDNSALVCYAKMACRINNEMTDYRRIITENLVSEGNTIINYSDKTDVSIKADITEVRDDNYLQEREDIASINIDDLDDTGYESLSNKKAKTTADRYREKKYMIRKRYQSDVTPDLIKLDDSGYYKELRLHYYLTTGKQFVTDRDIKQFQRFNIDGLICLQDVNPSQIATKINLLTYLNIPEILQLEKFTPDHPLILDMYDKFKHYIWDMQLFLGKMHPNMTCIQILRKVLKQLGLKIPRGNRQGGGQRLYYYSVAGLEDGREGIFQKWYQADTNKSEKYALPVEYTSQFSNNNIIGKLDETIKLAASQNHNETENAHKNCWVWDGHAWVGAILKHSEVLVNGTFKALVTLWNGLERYIWDQAHISIC